MHDIHTPGFSEKFARDLEERDAQGEVTFKLLPSQCLTVVAHLQLALRHPGAIGPSSKEVRKLINLLINKVATTDALRAGLEAGDDPACDVPRKV